MYRIREAISMITKYVILLGLFALFESIHSMLRIFHTSDKQNKHLSLATAAFNGFKLGLALGIVGDMLVKDFSKIRDIFGRG